MIDVKAKSLFDRLGGRLAVALVAALLSLLFAVKIWGADVWWHLATGRWVVEHGEIPKVDPFSFTAAGAPWINVNWLADLILYGTHSLGGPSALVLLMVLVGFGLLFSLGMALRLFGVRFPMTAATLAYAAVIVQPRFSMPRPSSLGGLFIAFGIYLCARWWAKRDWSVYLFVPLFAAWMFVHSSVVVCLAMCSILLAASLLFPTDREARVSLTVVTAALWAMFLFLDRGRQIITHIAAYDESSLVVKYTNEWAPITLDMTTVWIPWALFAIAVAGGALKFRSWPVPLGLAALGLVLGTRFLRHVYPAVLLTAPAAALTFQSIALTLEKKNMLLAARAAPALVFAVVTGSHFAANDGVVMVDNFGFGELTSNYPHDTLEALRRLPPGRTMNDYAIGGYLIWRGMPGGVYMDGRTAQVYDEKKIRELLDDIVRSPSGLGKVADRYRIVYGLTQFRAPFYQAMMILPEWIPVYFGDSTVLFVRRAELKRLDGTGLEPLSSVKYLDDGEWLSSFYGVILATPERREEFVRQYLKAAAQNPDSEILKEIIKFLSAQKPDVARSILEMCRTD
jgi:hypothetical protein